MASFLQRTVDRRLLENDDQVASHRMMSESSDSFREIQHKPFDLELEMSDFEIAGLSDAFHRYMDPKDKKIAFNELFHDLKAIGI